jgi:ribosome-associated toxin RatA of RatAB toxin-antitoxin module
MIRLMSAREPVHRTHFVTRSTPAEAYSVVTDFPAYPRLFPELKTARVVSTTGNVVRVEFRAEVVIAVRYVLDLACDAATLPVDWTFVEGEVVTGSTGAWRFTASGDGTTIDYRAALGRPVKIVNDAAMQALGSYKGGKMLFLGLGTGLGSALVVRGHIVPMELGALSYRKGTIEDHVGLRGLKKFGKKRWQKTVDVIAARLVSALLLDDFVIGGGQAKKLKSVPPACRLGSNANAFIGGFRMWTPTTNRHWHALTQGPYVPPAAANGEAARH